MFPPRALLLGGLALAVLVAAVMVGLLTAEGDDGESEGTELARSGSNGDDGGSGTAEGAEPGIDGGTSSEDVLARGVEIGCTMMREGATVNDFAIWFESDVGSAGPEEIELFQAMLVEALTVECPEVIPTDG